MDKVQALVFKTQNGSILEWVIKDYNTKIYIDGVEIKGKPPQIIASANITAVKEYMTAHFVYKDTKKDATDAFKEIKATCCIGDDEFVSIDAEYKYKKFIQSVESAYITEFVPVEVDVIIGQIIDTQNPHILCIPSFNAKIDIKTIQKGEYFHYSPSQRGLLEEVLKDYPTLKVEYPYDSGIQYVHINGYSPFYKLSFQPLRFITLSKAQAAYTNDIQNIRNQIINLLIQESKEVIDAKTLGCLYTKLDGILHSLGKISTLKSSESAMSSVREDIRKEMQMLKKLAGF